MPDLTDLFGGSATQRQAKCLFVDRRGAGVGETTSGHVTIEDRGSPVPSRNLVLCSLGPAVEHLKPYLSPAPFKAGQVVKYEGDTVDTVYFPTHGLVSARAVLQSGHEIECSLIGKTNAVGMTATLGFSRASSRLLWLTDGHAWKIALPHLAFAMRTLPTVESTLKRFCYAQMGYAVHVGVCNALHSAEHRLARWLANAADLLGQSEVLVAQEEVASGLGLQRSAVNPALQKLKLEGLIDVARGRIVIVDADRLGRRACECRLTLRRALCLDGILL